MSENPGQGPGPFKMHRPVEGISGGGGGSSFKTNKLLEVIAEASMRTAEANEPIRLPDKVAEQEALINRLVEQIESNDAQIVPTPGLYSSTNELTMRNLSQLFANEKCDTTIKERAVARLRLQHCFAVATAIPGSAKDAAPFLLQTFQNAESRKWALEGTDFAILRELPGIEVSKAFNLIQNAYTKGVDINGRNLRLGSKYIQLDEVDSVKSHLINQLGGGKEAKKALQIAERIAKATLETSVWNTDLIGSDPVAEAIYFQAYRSGRLNVARDRGPIITINRIKGFGTSYFRSAQTSVRSEIPDPNDPTKKINGFDGKPREFNKMLFLPNLDMHPAYISDMDDPADRVRLMRKRNSVDDPSNSESLDFATLDLKHLKSGDYAGWLGISVPRILVFKSMCLQTTTATKDVTSDAIEGWVAPSMTADPESALRLRAEYLVGFFGAIIENSIEAGTQGWDAIKFKGLINTLTRVIPTADGRTTYAYVSPAVAEWAVKVVEQTYKVSFKHETSWMAVRNILSRRGIM